MRGGCILSDKGVITHDDLDEEVSDRIFRQNAQQELSEKEKLELDKTRQENIIPMRDFLNQVVSYAKEFLRVDVRYKLNTGQQEISPLEDEIPILDNLSFVYWVFHKYEVFLGEPSKHNIQTFSSSNRLKTLVNIGAGLDLKGLEKGDILYFNKLRFVGIYTGDGNFIALTGPRKASEVGTVRLHKIKGTKWEKLFTGRVDRLIN